MSSTTEPGRSLDPKLLLEVWMGWEKGDTAPGMTLAELKKRGMRDLLEQLVADAGP